MSLAQAYLVRFAKLLIRNEPSPAHPYRIFLFWVLVYFFVICFFYWVIFFCGIFLIELFFGGIIL